MVLGVGQRGVLGGESTNVNGVPRKENTWPTIRASAVNAQERLALVPSLPSVKPPLKPFYPGKCTDLCAPTKGRLAAVSALHLNCAHIPHCHIYRRMPVTISVWGMHRHLRRQCTTSIVIVYGNESRISASDRRQPLARHHLLISNLVSSVVCLDETFHTPNPFPPLDALRALPGRHVARCDL